MDLVKVESVNIEEDAKAVASMRLAYKVCTCPTQILSFLTGIRKLDFHVNH